MNNISNNIALQERIYYRGKDILECSREELLAIILELMQTLEKEYEHHIKTLKWLEENI